MARISKEDHPAILRMVEAEGRTMASIAEEYGCSAANIGALVRKLRREAAETAETAQTQPALALDPAAASEAPAAAPPPEPEPEPEPEPDPTNIVAFDRPAPEPPAPAKPSRAAATLGARLAKPGFGLVMRSEEGDESMTPFRSLEDLLSAVKPILRASARNPETVWFSVQPVDLSTIEFDAA